MHKNIIDLLDKYNKKYPEKEAYVTKIDDSRQVYADYKLYFGINGKEEFEDEEEIIEHLWDNVYNKKIIELIDKLSKKGIDKRLIKNKKYFAVLPIAGQKAEGRLITDMSIEWLYPGLVKYTEQVIEGLESKLKKLEEQEMEAGQKEKKDLDQPNFESIYCGIDFGPNYPLSVEGQFAFSQLPLPPDGIAKMNKKMRDKYQENRDKKSKKEQEEEITEAYGEPCETCAGCEVRNECHDTQGIAYHPPCSIIDPRNLTKEKLIYKKEETANSICKIKKVNGEWEMELLKKKKKKELISYEKHFTSPCDSVEWINDKIEQGYLLDGILTVHPVGIYVTMKRVSDLKAKEQEQEAEKEIEEKPEFQENLTFRYNGSLLGVFHDGKYRISIGFNYKQKKEE